MDAVSAVLRWPTYFLLALIPRVYPPPYLFVIAIPWGRKCLNSLRLGCGAAPLPRVVGRHRRHRCHRGAGGNPDSSRVSLYMRTVSTDSLGPLDKTTVNVSNCHPPRGSGLLTPLTSFAVLGLLTTEPAS